MESEGGVDWFDGRNLPEQGDSLGVQVVLLTARNKTALSIPPLAPSSKISMFEEFAKDVFATEGAR